MARMAQVMGGATAAYAVAIIVRPEVMAKPCGMVDADGQAAAETCILIRGIGLRDLATSAAMLFAPTASSIRAACLVRAASDWSDAVVLGTSLPDADARKKAAAVSVVWGALCLLAGRL